jgi:hypothetical protein
MNEARIDVNSAVELLNNIDIIVTRCTNGDCEAIDAITQICSLLDEAKIPKAIKSPMCG